MHAYGCGVLVVAEQVECVCVCVYVYVCVCVCVCVCMSERESGHSAQSLMYIPTGIGGFIAWSMMYIYAHIHTHPNIHTRVCACIGDVYSWGQGESGELGHATKILMYAPTEIGDLHDVRFIAAGHRHAAAITFRYCVYVSAHVYIYIYVYIYINIYMYICICIYVYICICL